MKTNQIIRGHALEELKKFPDGSINMLMTSPPYWALRDYSNETEIIWDTNKDCEHDFEIEERKLHGGSTSKKWAKTVSKGMKKGEWKTKDGFCNKCGVWKGQLGLEPTFDLYIKHLCDIFDEVKRVLRDDGTIWVNLGDTYGGSGSGQEYDSFTKDKPEKYQEKWVTTQRPTTKMNYASKCLVMIPSRFAIEMVNRGWILRNTIIWYKRNCMPSSVKDRFTVDFEYLFFFSKKKNYYFETQYEPTSSNSDFKVKSMGDVPYAITGNQNLGKGSRGNPIGRNKRTVWSINPQPFGENVCMICGYFDKPRSKQQKKGYFGGEDKSESVCKGCGTSLITSHFAIYPEELCETPIKAGCPEFVCNKCGDPKEKVLEHNKISETGEDLLETKKTPYSIQERKGFVKIRKLPDIKEFSDYLNEHRKRLGLSIDKVEEIMNSQAPHHWFGVESYPSVEDYELLKDILELGNIYDEQMTKEYFKPAEKQNLDYSEKGYKPTCNCNAEFTSGIVLDPFFGAGTTGLVALKQNKKFIGIELNKEYIKISKERLKPFLEQKRL